MHLTIPPLTLSIEGLTETEIPMNSRQFITQEEGTADITYRFHLTEELPQPDDTWKVTFERPDIRVYRKGEREARLLAVGTMNATYALYQETEEGTTDIWFLNTLKEDLKIDTIFISCLALERHTAMRGCYTLHCCFLNYNGQAILFSGRSGIGKSTHAGLWCQHIENAHVVNGDRCLLCPDGKSGYVASGWPVCGSSNICRKETLPVRAIVFMEQDAENKVVKATPMQLFKLLSSQLTINWWNAEHTRKALDAAQNLLGKTGMCIYACNLTPEAPHTLQQYLKEKQWIN